MDNFFLSTKAIKFTKQRGHSKIQTFRWPPESKHYQSDQWPTGFFDLYVIFVHAQCLQCIEMLKHLSMFGSCLFPLHHCRTVQCNSFEFCTSDSISDQYWREIFLKFLLILSRKKSTSLNFRNIQTKLSRWNRIAPNDDYVSHKSAFREGIHDSI